ncbi:MAG: hypothetical protein GF317_17270 [Candidatus Lokiarchaeota archaeon]|nr:hypothetical protein [Candidatus Lokiarchaeota archaeon]MBD3201270.1 hypothetical protein [Candidatus Lokiarchaeota archaeon]
MQIQRKKLIIYSLLGTFFYILLPYIVIYILTELDIFEFSSSFTLSLLIFGSVGILISVSKYFFPENSLNRHIIGIGTSIFSGIYLFFIFGGFNINQTLGNYYIETSNSQVLLGLQVIAWLLLGGSLLRILSNIIKLIEFKQDRDITIFHKDSLKLTKIFNILGVLVYLVLSVYLITTIYSGSQISIILHENYDFTYEENTIIDPDDDTIDITNYFDITNLGFYDISEVYIDLYIFTLNTTDNLQVALPNNTQIGEALNIYYKIFPANYISKNNNITISIFPEWVPGLITYDANLIIYFSLSGSYAGINFVFNSSVRTFWNSALIP